MKSLDFLVESIVGDLRNSLVKGLKPEHGPGTPVYDNITKEFDKAASMAKTRFRKGEDMESGVDNSKVVWFLTWWVLDTKLGLIQQAQRLSGVSPSVYPADSPERASLEQHHHVFTDKEVQKIQNKAKNATNWVGTMDPSLETRGIFPDNSSSSFVQALIHSLGTHGISDKVRAMSLKPDMTPIQAVEGWKEIEDDWLQSLKDEKRSIAHDSEYRFGRYTAGPRAYKSGKPVDYLETIIEFKDGSAWFNLNREECKKEGESMGHCGNVAGHKTTDTIYSYRTAHPDKENHWIPHLTFIYNEETGMLGEMKGYGNQKPTKKYHDVIKTLIMSEHIKGIVGGGYLPEENFSVWDLDDAEELVEKKPKLAGDNLTKYMNRMGVDESFEGMVQAKLGEDTVFEIIDKEKIDNMSKSYRLDLVEVRLTEIYPNFEALMEGEFHDSPYWQLLKGTGEWSIDETASAIVNEKDGEKEWEERFEQIMYYSPSQVKSIIVDELVHYSKDKPDDVEENMWSYIQDYGGDFADWIVQTTIDATEIGYQHAVRDSVKENAIRYIEEFGNGYLSYGAKEVELTIVAEAPGRWDRENNPVYIQGKMMEVIDVITDMENGGETIPNDWWSYHAVEYDDRDMFRQDEIIEDVHYDYIKAIQYFNEQIMEAPKLYDGTEFYVKYNELNKDDKGSPGTAGDKEKYIKHFSNESEQNWKPVLDEEGKDLMLPLVKKLNKVARTKTASKKEHDSIHRLAQLAGIKNPDKTVHKVLKKRGYT